MPEWDFPEDWASLEHLGSLTFNDWEKEDLEKRKPKEKIPFGFQAPKPKPKSNRQKKRERRGKSAK